MISVQQSAFQVREHGIQGLNAAGGGAAVKDKHILGIQREDGLPGCLLAMGCLLGFANRLAQIVGPQLIGDHIELGSGAHQSQDIGIVHASKERRQHRTNEQHIQSRSMPMLIPW